jgi:hypothetical protein
MKRKDAVRLFDEFNMQRMSTFTRGALVTLLNYEGDPLTEYLLQTICAGQFLNVKRELEALGLCQFTKNNDGTITFSHIITPGEAFRDHDRQRKSKHNLEAKA